MEKINRCRLVPSCFACSEPIHCKYSIITGKGKCIYMSEIFTCKSDEAEKEAIEQFKKSLED